MSESPHQFEEMEKQDIAASMKVARLRHREGDLEAAQELYHGIMERDPANPDVYYQLGILALQRESLGLAQNYFRLAAELDPEQTAFNFGTSHVSAVRD